MYPHPDFGDLQVHTDRELAEALGAEVVRRRAVQQWPLAATEEVELRDGRRFAYKTQLPPNVEPEFYDRARSPLLPRSVDLGPAGRGHALAVEWIDGPTLAADRGDPVRYLRHAVEVVDALSTIGGDDVPVHLDLGTEPEWRAASGTTADRLEELVAARRFTRVGPVDLDAFRRWAERDETIAAATRDPGVVHADLGPEEVFLPAAPGGSLRVIDWQRPVRGPRAIDLVGLLRAGGVEPRRHVEPSALRFDAFVRLHWAALCASEVLPHLPPGGYEAWTVEALGVILAP